MNPTTEPTRLIGAINTAIAATLGVLVLTGVLDDKVAGGLIVALGAWVAVGSEWLRSKVTPTGQVALTVDEADALNADHP